MLFFKKPNAQRIQAILQEAHLAPLTYSEVGASRHNPPKGYNLDHNRIRLGYGKACFQRAKDAIRHWQPFCFPWLELHDSATPIAVGECVGVLIKVCGLWSFIPSRIVYVLDEQGATDIFGFAYGTLQGHMESGEERFSVEWHHEDDSVWYDILAFSKPNHILVKCIYPYARHLQRQFARDSLQTVLKFIQISDLEDAPKERYLQW